MLRQHAQSRTHHATAAGATTTPAAELVDVDAGARLDDEGGAGDYGVADHNHVASAVCLHQRIHCSGATGACVRKSEDGGSARAQMNEASWPAGEVCLFMCVHGCVGAPTEVVGGQARVGKGGVWGRGVVGG